MYTNLQPERDVFGNTDEKKMVTLDGTIVVTYRGNIYNIPKRVYIIFICPRFIQPIVSNKPTTSKKNTQGRHVETNDKINLPL